MEEEKVGHWKQAEKLLLEKIKLQEEKIKQLEEGRNIPGEIKAPIVLMATVPGVVAEIKTFLPVVKLKDGEMYNKPIGWKMSVDNDKYENIVYSYPNAGDPISYDLMKEIEKEYKKYGVIMWDSTKESKEQATQRGWKSFIEWTMILERKILTRHAELRENDKKELIPTKDEWSLEYPIESKYFKIRDKISKLVDGV